VDERGFVEALIAAMPEAFDGPTAREDFLDDEPLAYPALGHARSWLEDDAIKVWWVPLRARVRPGCEDAVRRFWAFVEEQAQAGAGDVELANLLQIECFEGAGWVEDVGEYLGPRTRELLVDAQDGLARSNGQVGRWATSWRTRPR
jgi:hypothetical protein